MRAWLKGGLIGAGTATIFAALYLPLVFIGLIDDSGMLSRILFFLGTPTWWLFYMFLRFFKRGSLELLMILTISVGPIFMAFIYGILGGWIISKIDKANWIKGMVFGAVFSLLSLLIFSVSSSIMGGFNLLEDFVKSLYIFVMIFIIFTIIPTIILYLVDWRNRIKSKKQEET